MRALYKNGTISSATMMMILMSGLIAGPAVSLIRIADGVTGDGRFVRVRALAAEVTFFDVLLGVVPGAAIFKHGAGI